MTASRSTGRLDLSRAETGGMGGLNDFSDRVLFLLSELSNEEETLRLQFTEVELLIRQNRGELEKWRGREKTVEAQVQKMEADLDAYSRSDIAATYAQHIEVRQRVFVFHSQVEQLEIRRNYLSSLLTRIARISSVFQAVQDKSTHPAEGGVNTPSNAGMVSHQVNARSQQGVDGLRREPQIAPPPLHLRHLAAQMDAALIGGSDREDSHPSEAAGDQQLGWAPRDPFGEHLFSALEDVYERAARDMANGPAQSLTNLVLRAEICERAAGGDPAVARLQLDLLKREATKLLDEVRNQIFELRPMILDDLGLVPTIRRYVDQFKDKLGIEADCVVGDIPRQPSAFETAVFRIVQEALKNVAQHARARHTQVVVEEREGQLMVRIEDDGIGFDMRTSGALGSTADYSLLKGHGGMAQQAEMFGGTLYLDSAPGAGTRVVARIPLVIDKSSSGNDAW